MKLCVAQKLLLLALMPFFSLKLSAQILPSDTVRVSKQCSLIRELVTIGLEKHFATIQLQQTGSTYGYMPNGAWEFATLRYDADLKWPGANRSYLENYTDKTLAAETVSWQYVAEYNRLPNAAVAQRMYTYLNRQIEGCQFPINDSIQVDFEPLPSDSLPKDRPAMLETASLYGLPSLEKPTASSIHVMVGMEKRSNDNYNVCLIVENVVKATASKPSSVAAKF